MKLIGTYFSPFTRRVAVALMALGIPYEHDDLNGYTDPDRARQLNPVAKVPVLVLDNGEQLIDSAVMLDYLDEWAGTERALTPPAGVDRRAILQLTAIATTLYEQTTARHFEEQRTPDCIQLQLIERYRLQTIGGLQALDIASNAKGVIRKVPLNRATISAVVAFDYARMLHPDLDPATIAPNLAKVVLALSNEPAFQQTLP
ncbi:MAG: glutathione S-transferase N-terminal domain-containing protein [Scytolyngbya sp. HA4215-MV1]|nr:glutathione S-transferase N-terminal domain-containing protein [Scytolyngbya sp. HA4215-MV1]